MKKVGKRKKEWLKMSCVEKKIARLEVMKLNMEKRERKKRGGGSPP